MSDIEEPAAKVSKLENEESVEGEDMDIGQEEWLSEEILTDDDYTAAADRDNSDSNANTSQDEANSQYEGNNDSMDNSAHDTAQTTGENIEQTLNNFESGQQRTGQAELPEELGAFLVRKTDARPAEPPPPPKQPESDMDESTKQSEDDGNDTDDLLRMLGEEGGKKGSPGAAGAPPREAQSTDDDDDAYIFEGARVTRLKVSKDVNNESSAKKLKVAKGAFIQQRSARRAPPEDTSDKEADNIVSSKVSLLSSAKPRARGPRGPRPARRAPDDLSEGEESGVMSSDETQLMRRMFGGARGARGARGRGINAVRTVTKRVISIDKNASTASDKSSTSTRAPAKLGPKSATRSRSSPQPSTRSRSSPQRAVRMAPKPAAKSSPAAVAKRAAPGKSEVEDEESQDTSETGPRRQPLMTPEQMDEEVPSDAESRSDEDSFYDEMPSSDSEDADDWFTLDVRGEKAADYIPMLGPDAKSLLTAEQQRAEARLTALQRSAGALVAGRRSLAAQLRAARASIAQLDAALAQ